MMNRKSLSGAMIGAISWIAGYWMIRFVGGGMSAVDAYALLVGWWFTAYVSSRFALSIAVAVLLSLGYWVLFVIAALVGQPWFYRDVLDLTFPAVLWIGLLQAVVIGSPILFDRLFQRVSQIGSHVHSSDS
ncbi:MAG: hypothetical protein K0M39_04835 [Rhizobium sp.]|nr:hypothetical protein [Rhizobium sp.]